MQNIEYRIQHALISDIKRHLKAVQLDQPTFPLNVQNISQYAEKLATKSITYEAWIGENLIGLIAVYFNKITAEAFVSNVSVSPNMVHKKLASTLMQNFISDAETRKTQSINLVYAENNIPAHKLYQKFGFIFIENNDGEIQVQRSLGDDS